MKYLIYLKMTYFKDTKMYWYEIYAYNKTYTSNNNNYNNNISKDKFFCKKCDINEIIQI